MNPQETSSKATSAADRLTALVLLLFCMLAAAFF
jgi:hypothetical protein